MPTTRFSNFRLYQEPSWRSLLSHSDRSVPKQWRDWLLDTGSLTQRLIDASENTLTVQIINQRIDIPRFTEQRALKLPPRRLTMIREVVLLANSTPWVYARSIIPLTTLTGRLRKLRHLDNQPLGALLFRDPTMTREAVEVACHTKVNAKLPTTLLGGLQKSLWGRRSVFRLDAKPLLVSEVFLPDFKPYNQTLHFGFASAP
ncbi:chorismate lyase [Porticoccaceae bacterium]|nr:chorismate lyase [Porticoccaceae bacterium]